MQKNMHDRSKNTFQNYFHPQHPQSRAEYIKIMGQDCDDLSGNEFLNNEGEHSHKRFTFNRNCQDMIKQQEEEDFMRVDCEEILRMQKKVSWLKHENLRLVQESTQNMQLFNTYMKQMQQRASQDSLEVDSLKTRIRMLEDMCQISENRAKKAQLKLITEQKIKKDCSIQTEEKTYRFFSMMENRLQKPDSKKAQTSSINKQNCMKEGHITQLKESNNLASSLQNDMKLRKVEEDYQQVRSAYFRTITNSPRASLSKPSPSANTLALQFAQSPALNALLSPRNTHMPPIPYFGPSPSANREKADKTIWGSGMQFEGKMKRVK